MKLSHLSLAVFAAISLAACGGSGSDNNAVDNSNNNVPEKKPESKPQPQPQPQPDAGTEIVDPTGDEVVSRFYLNTQSSVGTTQYLRNSASNFDLINNPRVVDGKRDDKPASATAILGVDLNRQNPWFTNFVAARTEAVNNKGNKVTVAQYLGTNKTGRAGLQDSESLQQENEKNIARFTDSIDNQSNKDNLAALEKQLADYNKRIKDINEALKDNATTNKPALELEKTVAQKYQVLLTQLVKEGKSGNNIGNFTLDNVIWGDGIATNKNKPAIGLVGMNFAEQDNDGNIVTGKTKKIQGTDDKAISTTRIFGRYFLEDDNPLASFNLDSNNTSNYNSYRGATTVLNANHKIPNAGTPQSKDSYTNNLDSRNIAAVPMKLVNVQYGRVTGQLDPVLKSTIDGKDSGVVEQRGPFLARNDKNAVNYYFYRGTDATTLAEMSKLPSNAAYEYNGHALMYGIDNSFHGNGQNLPNSFGDTGSKGLGNFVYAKYDVGQQRVGGKVYNVWMFDHENGQLTSDVLVEFGGKVTGNTVVGAAELAYDANAPKADFRGAFFGDKAQELGGSFNSTTFEEKYDTVAWGGVFGAQRAADKAAPTQPKKPEIINNSWLGDIAADIRKN